LRVWPAAPLRVNVDNRSRGLPMLFQMLTPRANGIED
jgi:hypothetical protein